MSRWTHVIGTIHINGGNNIKLDLQTFVNRYSKLIPGGSEDGVITIVNGTDRSTGWSSSEGHIHGDGLLTIMGDLRNMSSEELEKGLQKFVNKLSKRYLIEKLIIYIQDDWEMQSKILAIRHNMVDTSAIMLSKPEEKIN